MHLSYTAAWAIPITSFVSGSQNLFGWYWQTLVMVVNSHWDQHLLEFSSTSKILLPAYTVRICIPVHMAAEVSSHGSRGQFTKANYFRFSDCELSMVMQGYRWFTPYPIGQKSEKIKINTSATELINSSESGWFCFILFCFGCMFFVVFHLVSLGWFYFGLFWFLFTLFWGVCAFSLWLFFFFVVLPFFVFWGYFCGN